MRFTRKRRWARKLPYNRWPGSKSRGAPPTRPPSADDPRRATGRPAHRCPQAQVPSLHSRRDRWGHGRARLSPKPAHTRRDHPARGRQERQRLSASGRAVTGPKNTVQDRLTAFHELPRSGQRARPRRKRGGQDPFRAASASGCIRLSEAESLIDFVEVFADSLQRSRNDHVATTGLLELCRAAAPPRRR